MRNLKGRLTLIAAIGCLALVAVAQQRRQASHNQPNRPWIDLELVVVKH
jgi:hypothetical protein